jgi:hypothetical protein
MLNSKNYILRTCLLINFLLLSACGDNKSLSNSGTGGKEIDSLQEFKLTKYYNRLEKRKLSLGLLRQDGGGTDTPFDVEDIVEAFEQLAFYNEYHIDENRLLPDKETVNLGKWNSKINIAILFGALVDNKQKEKDLLDINNLLFILSNATKHEIEITKQNVNMYVVVGNQKEVEEIVSEISLNSPEFNLKRLPIISQLPKEIHCLAMTSISSEPSSEIKTALVIIRSELPNLMRTACFHEEIAQSLGLTNDSHLARPSIFNDDDEFATLTKLDKILLQILYDSRLYSGISKQESSQILRQVANEIAGALNY